MIGLIWHYDSKLCSDFLDDKDRLTSISSLAALLPGVMRHRRLCLTDVRSRSILGNIDCGTDRRLKAPGSKPISRGLAECRCPAQSLMPILHCIPPRSSLQLPLQLPLQHPSTSAILNAGSFVIESLQIYPADLSCNKRSRRRTNARNLFFYLSLNLI